MDYRLNSMLSFRTFLALLRDVFQFANDADLPVAILPPDQEKAFERIDWPFLGWVLVFILNGLISYVLTSEVQLFLMTIRGVIFQTIPGSTTGLPLVSSPLCLDNGGLGCQHQNPSCHQGSYAASFFGAFTCFVHIR